MKVRQVIKYVAPPVAVDVARRLRGRTDGIANELETYVRNGKIPWTTGYLTFRNHFVATVLSDDALMKGFAEHADLPPGYGIGIDERCIEYPWLMANLNRAPELLLDAGSALNHEFILNHSPLSQNTVHILTLAPEANCYWANGVSYIFADLRDIPIRDNYYDKVACVSTLEHVGLDASVYSADPIHRENRPQDFILAVRELRRILRPGGTLFLSVPFGKYQNLVVQQQFDMDLLSLAIAAFGETEETTLQFYRYSSEGWKRSTAAACADSEYVGWWSPAVVSNQWPDPIPLEPDSAANARAVACVKLVKST